MATGNIWQVLVGRLAACTVDVMSQACTIAGQVDGRRRQMHCTSQRGWKQCKQRSVIVRDRGVGGAIQDCNDGGCK
eukprot:6302580-Amphidinium_carterae.3